MLPGSDIAQSNILRSGGEITAVVAAKVDPPSACIKASAFSSSLLDFLYTSSSAI